ncbi:MAG: universal stress protein [Bacteroidetes bacterium]|nr:universal stress protein [Bacteroidota bacterium]MCB0842245.1 universal stress protein [Bacteroidota bacterium]MCB0854163.1 universal stress protein [Bacteroidota bacterium]
MNNILVPVKLSSDFKNHLRYVASVATKSAAKVTFFYAGAKKLPHYGKPTFQTQEEVELLKQSISSQLIHDAITWISDTFSAKNIDFQFKFASRNSVSEIIKETNQGNYQMVIMGTHSRSGLFNYFSSHLASRVIAGVKTPVFVVPSKSSFNEIENITYAVDLTDYDPEVIQQVKTIASIFDAKLTIAHVNESEVEKERYVHSLEQTISDTLDYPKVYYKFFDHADPLRGIIKFVNQNNSQLVAMINRKKFSWRSLFRRNSFTLKMTQETSVPILAFSKF